MARVPEAAIERAVAELAPELRAAIDVAGARIARVNEGLAFGPGPGGIAVAMAVAGMFGLKTVVGIGPTDFAVLADDSADARLGSRQ